MDVGLAYVDICQSLKTDVVVCYFCRSQQCVFGSCCVDEPVETQLTLFYKLEAEESKRLTSLPPSNAFEEMICWTEEGKLWTFPIDNEQGTTVLGDPAE